MLQFRRAAAADQTRTRTAPLDIEHGGVWSLSSDQADALGAPAADRIGFLRLAPCDESNRHGEFGPADLLAALWWGRRQVLALRNGTSEGLSYTGRAFAPLGQTRNVAPDVTGNAVAVLFSSRGGPIVFNSTTWLSGGQTLGGFADPALPAMPYDPARRARRRPVAGLRALAPGLRGALAG